MVGAMTVDALVEKGWLRFPASQDVRDWIAAATPHVEAALADRQNESLYLCGRTWFVGTHAFPNDGRGAVRNGPPLPEHFLDVVRRHLNATAIELDRGQISVCFPGYPRQSAGEPDAAYRFRRRRDGAHIDGLLAVGPERRRFLREHHGFLLGIPLGDVDPDRSPLVVWEGAHRIIRDALSHAFAGKRPEDWREIDVTEAYHAARRAVFETCRRVEITSVHGEAYLVHRHALHGMAPWTGGKDAARRAVIYFRPACLSAEDWLFRP